MAAQLTERDLEIFDTLTRRVRVLSLEQIARTWWPDSANPTRTAEGRIKSFAAEGLLKIEHAPAHPELDLQNPVAQWSPGDEDPDHGATSYRLQSRWRLHPILTPCISASRLAAARFGGYGGRPPKDVERTHDIHMARVFLFYRTRQPDLVRYWVFEEQIKAERKRSRSLYGQKLPDVFLRCGGSVRVIEFGGAYSKEKLFSFHDYCKGNALPYEIW